MESILLTIKKMLGLEPEYTPFDTDIIVLINSSLMRLHQIGIGPKGGLRISDDLTKWSDLINDESCLNSIQEFIFIRTKLSFDPPQTSFVIQAYKDRADELEWCLMVEAEYEGANGGSSGPTYIYDGPYVVDPSFDQQVLDTDNKKLLDDVTVNKIKVTSTRNPSGGNTLSI